MYKCPSGWECFFAVVAWWAILLVPGPRAAVSSPPNCDLLSPHPIDGVSGTVLSGLIEVPENWERREGRRIHLHVVVLQAEQTPSEPDPIFVLQGGPGQAVTDLAAFYAEFLQNSRRLRDVILVDQRGTGGSNSLSFEIAPEQFFLDLAAIVPTEWIGKARKDLEIRADLSQYTTISATIDLDHVRETLGYKSINLYGTSYGTRCALHYLRSFPNCVRTVVLKNVLPMDIPIPLSYARNTDRALHLLFDDCQADDVCRKANPTFATHLTEVLLRLSKERVTMTVTHPVTKAAEQIQVSRDATAMALRQLLMSPQTRTSIPNLIEKAWRGDIQPLGEAIVRMRAGYLRGLAHGMSLSVLAGEDCPRLTRESIDQETQGTLMGQAAVSRIQSACMLWPSKGVPSSFFDPVRSDKPVLLVSGRLDPATPPEYGESVAKNLSNSRHVVFMHAAHPNVGFEGLNTLVASFYETGTVVGLDASCAMKGAPPRFPE